MQTVYYLEPRSTQKHRIGPNTIISDLFSFRCKECFKATVREDRAGYHQHIDEKRPFFFF